MQIGHCFIVYRCRKSRQDYFGSLFLPLGSNLTVWITPSVSELHLESFAAPSTLLVHKQQHHCLFFLTENPLQYDTVWSADGSFVCWVLIEYAAFFIELLPSSLSAQAQIVGRSPGSHLNCRPVVALHSGKQQHGLSASIFLSTPTEESSGHWFLKPLLALRNELKYIGQWSFTLRALARETGLRITCFLPPLHFLARKVHNLGLILRGSSEMR